MLVHATGLRDTAVLLIVPPLATGMPVDCIYGEDVNQQVSSVACPCAIRKSRTIKPHSMVGFKRNFGRARQGTCSRSARANSLQLASVFDYPASWRTDRHRIFN